MKKIVILNVGGALSVYAEFSDKKVMVDLGSSSDFSPVNDFLIPLSKKGKFNKDKNGEKYVIDQLFLSHLDRDHISDYEKFRDVFSVGFMTCPNDNDNQDDDFKVNKELLGDDYDTRDMVLEDMRLRFVESPLYPEISPSNPLISIIEEISLHYIKPSVCEKEGDLVSNYANNISLVLFLKVENKTLLLPGDMLKEGMKYLLENDEKNLTDLLENNELDFLVAPHHGLQTSFSEELFQAMGGNKTRLNIISEKVREENSDENRSEVDKRYYSSDYSTGKNSLEQMAVKTSLGHIVVDFESDEAEIHKYEDINDVISEFV